MLLTAIAALVSGCTTDPPKAAFGLDPNPTSGQVVTFDGSASSPGRDDVDHPSPIAVWEWDLDGNGTFEKVTSGPRVQHTYDGERTVEVSLRVVTERAAESAVVTKTVVTTEGQTAMAPASGACPTDPADGNACGTGPAGNPLEATREDVPFVKQPRTDQPPLFSAFFGGTWADQGQPEQPVSIVQGADRVYALDNTDDVDMYDATSLAHLGEFDVTDDSRDLAFYKGEVYVLNADGSVEVFSSEGTLVRVLRALPINGVLGATETLSAASLTVAWNEIWSTMSLGDQSGGAVVVRNATTGAIKSVVVHRSGTACMVTAYNLDGSHWCVARNNQAMSTDGPHTSGAFWARAGISAVPELSALFSKCRSISRSNAFALTTGREHVTFGEPVFGAACGEKWISNRFMGTDAPAGMRTFFQLENTPGYGDFVDEIRLEAHTGTSVYDAATVGPYRGYGGRTWRPQDAWSNNDRDIAYRPREAKIDWSGVLTRDPSGWLHSPGAAEDKCLHYVVSDADIYVAGYRGERWYDLARDLVNVELVYEGTVIKTSTAAEGDFCINTRGTYNGKQIESGTRRLEVRANLSDPARSVTSVNANLQIDDTPPTGHLVAPETYVKGTVPFGGQMDDAHAGPRSWALEVLPPGGIWRRVCDGEPVPDSTGRWRCGWNTADGQFPDGNYEVRAVMTDRASDGGNTSVTGQATVEVDNIVEAPEDGGSALDTIDEAFDQEWEDVGLPDTAEEGGAPDDEESQSSDADVDPGGNNVVICATNDDWGETVLPTYIEPAPGEPVLNLTPESALVSLMAADVMPLVPASAFEQVDRTAEYVIYAAKVNGQTRAFAVVENLPRVGWVGTYYEGCSTFPQELGPVRIP